MEITYLDSFKVLCHIVSIGGNLQHTYLTTLNATVHSLEKVDILKQNFKSLPQQLEHAKENKNNHIHTKKWVSNQASNFYTCCSVYLQVKW